jgi:hypothetical protein
MYLWNKILLGVIIVVAAVFFYFASYSAKIHSSWLKQVEKKQKELRDLREENKNLVEGESGLRTERMELYRLTIDRPRVWRKCDAQVRANPLAVQVTTDQPDPSGIVEKMILYAFEESSDKNRGRYLGEFTVTKASGKQLDLAPITNLYAPDMAKLTSAKPPWILYEYLPRDDHMIFKKLPDDQKKAMLPEATANEYVRDGQPAAADDPPQRKDPQGNYLRQLRDYTQLLAIYRERQSDLFDQMESLRRDVQYTKTAVADAQRQNQSSQKLIAELKARTAKAGEERDFVDQYRRQLTAEVEKLQKESNTIHEENRAMAGRLAQSQGEAAQRIEQRVRAMVQQPGNGLK